MCLGKKEPDDRDHFGKKRLDLAGSFIGKLVPYFIQKLTKDIYNYMQRCVENGGDFNVTLAVKSQTITDGLRYSLATGNWGEQRKP